jgi:acetyltransferase-like isoleucine patch superfamily enzyme
MRTLVNGILQVLARRKILRLAGVEIHPTAKVNYRAVRYRPGSCIQIGEGSMVEGRLVCEKDGACIVIGRNSFIGGTLLSSASRIQIGDDVLIGWGGNILDHNSHAIGWAQRKDDVKNWYFNKKDWTHVLAKPVRIYDKAWLGLNVTILKGVEIGEGAVVAAGSVVTKNVSPWTVVAGNPAREIREIPFEDR